MRAIDPSGIVYFGLGCFGVGASAVLFLASIKPKWFSRPPATRKTRWTRS